MKATTTANSSEPEKSAIEAAHDFGQAQVEFSGSIHGDTFEVALRHLEGVADDARLKFTEQGLYAFRLCDDLVTGVRIFIPPTEWEQYNLTLPGTVVVNVKALSKTLRGLKTRKRDSDFLDFDVLSRGEESRFTVTDSQLATESVPIRPEGSVPSTRDLPDLTPTVDLTLGDANVLREWVKSLPSKKGHSVKVTATTDADDDRPALTLEHRENEGTKHSSDWQIRDTLVLSESISGFEWGAKPDGSVDDAELVGEAFFAHGLNTKLVTSHYQTKYLKYWAKRLRKTRTEGVSYRLEFGHEWPLYLTRDDGSEVHAQFLLAPRIDVA